MIERKSRMPFSSSTTSIWFMFSAHHIRQRSIGTFMSRARIGDVFSHRKRDAEVRSLPRLALDIDRSPVILDDPIDNRKAKPGAAGLGRKERMEDFIYILSRDPLAAVRNNHPEPFGVVAAI